MARINGVSKIWVMQQMKVYRPLRFRGMVENRNQLPLSDNTLNDCRFVHNDNTFYVWTNDVSYGENGDWEDVGLVNPPPTEVINVPDGYVL